MIGYRAAMFVAIFPTGDNRQATACLLPWMKVPVEKRVFVEGATFSQRSKSFLWESISMEKGGKTWKWQNCFLSKYTTDHNTINYENIIKGIAFRNRTMKTEIYLRTKIIADSGAESIVQTRYFCRFPPVTLKS